MRSEIGIISIAIVDTTFHIGKEDYPVQYQAPYLVVKYLGSRLSLRHIWWFHIREEDYLVIAKSDAIFGGGVIFEKRIIRAF